MNKGLEALENICNQCEHYQFEKGLRPKKCPFNKSCVFKQRIEKELKALEIIKELFDIKVVLIYPSGDYELDIYNKNSLILYTYAKLPKEEYDLLKEVLL